MRRIRAAPASSLEDMATVSPARIRLLFNSCSHVSNTSTAVVFRSMSKTRWLMIALCFSATAINYVDRATLAVSAPFIQRELGFSFATLGLLLSRFFWTYALMQLAPKKIMSQHSVDSQSVAIALRRNLKMSLST